MSVFNAPLGTNLTNNDLINKTPFVAHFEIGYNITPPVEDFMITEAGDFMLTEAGDFMILE